MFRSLSSIVNTGHGVNKMTKKSDDFLKQLVEREIAADEIAVYPSTRFELDIVDATRVLLRVHFFASPDDRANNKPTSLNFVVPGGEVARLSNLLTLVLKELKAGNRKRVQLADLTNRITGPYTMTAKASEDAHLRELSVDAFNRLVRENPRLSMIVLQIMVGEIQSARGALSSSL